MRQFLKGIRWAGAALVVGCTLLMAACDSGSTASPAVDPNAIVVATASGSVRGLDGVNGRFFLGIPFAAPPVGDLRWKAPQPVQPWSGIRDAKAYGNRCPQFATPIGNAAGDNEDCLYLNVFVPERQAGSAPLPVMLWLHGGSWMIGSGNDYPGDVLAAQGNVIVVTTNYRLGPFGYLALRGLADEDSHGSTGAYGALDQVAALQWVHDNISGFGGDPGNITLFGESAGGISICQLMASPLAKGLFQKAIIESGPCMTPAVTVAANERYGASFVSRPALGCGAFDPAEIVACMRGKSADEILNAETALEQQNIADAFGPAIDGYVLPESPAAAIADGSFARLPIINGSNHDEGKLFVALTYDLAIPPQALDSDNYAVALDAGLLDFDSSLAPLLGLLNPLILAQYPLDQFPTPQGYDPFYGAAHEAVSAVFTDAVFGCESDKADGLFSRLGAPLYAYEFSDPNPPAPYSDPYLPPPMSGHAAELVYVFQQVLEGGAVSPAQLSTNQVQLSTQMQKYWARFAYSGDPNGDGLPPWPAFGQSNLQLLTLAPGPDGIAPMSEEAFKAEHHCGFWSLLSL